MIPLELIEDYLIDQDEGVKRLLTWFLNLVMQNEALEQLGAERYQRTQTRGRVCHLLNWHSNG